MNDFAEINYGAFDIVRSCVAFTAANTYLAGPQRGRHFRIDSARIVLIAFFQFVTFYWVANQRMAASLTNNACNRAL